MNEQQLTELKRIKIILSAVTGFEDDDQEYIEDAYRTLKSIISQDALHKMAEESRTSGLRLDDWDKIGCVNHDCDKCKAVGEIKTEVKEDGNGSFTITDAHSTADVVRWLLTQDTKETILCLIDEESQPAPVQEPVFCEYCGGNDDADFGLPRDHCTDCARPQPVPVKTYHDGKPWPVAPKPWAGLSEKEVEAYDSWADFQVGCGRQTLFDMVRDIEAKLKEKNHDH
jgi:hypothetical protein